MTYSLRDDGCVVRDSDGACIPPVTDNRDYMEYLLWIENGNTPKEAPAATAVIVKDACSVDKSD